MSAKSPNPIEPVHLSFLDATATTASYVTFPIKLFVCEADLGSAAQKTYRSVLTAP